jgi:hypothetical protein
VLAHWQAFRAGIEGTALSELTDYVRRPIP